MIPAPSPVNEQQFETAAAARAELRAIAMASLAPHTVTSRDLGAAASAAALHVHEQGGEDVVLRRSLGHKSYAEARAMLRARRRPTV